MFGLFKRNKNQFISKNCQKNVKQYLEKMEQLQKDFELTSILSKPDNEKINWLIREVINIKKQLNKKIT